VLELESGVTAIVGPNGCGKSNIVDAVRWVLGEQSIRTLRGLRTEDMIFNGTEDRAPLGYAEVTLTLDNTWDVLPVDFDEVSVTRRAFRSGDNEYLINKARCRLRDVLELFMDTGIGAHAYSLISQGQVDMILSSKPEDRRTLLDEAAGVAKYKARRKLALRKLAAAENNLLRLGDIINEVARQMRSLKRQVGAASRYGQYEKELRDIEVRHAYGQYVSLVGQEKNLRQGILQVKGDQEAAAAALSKEEAAREQFGLNLLECDRQLLASRENVHSIDSQMDKLEGQSLVFKERLNAAAKGKQRANQDSERLESAAEEMQAELDSIENKRQELFKKSEETRDKLTQKEKKLADAVKVVEESEQAIETFRSSAARAADERAAVAARIESIASNVRTTEGRIKGLSERETSVQSRLKDCLKLSEKLEAEVRTHERSLGDLEKKREASRQALSQKVSERNTLEVELNNAKEQRAEKNSRLESLREMRDRYEGFYAGARAVLMAKKDGEKYAKGVLGHVAELIQVEKQYEAAVEAALGDHVQAIVTNSVSDIEKCVDVLKQSATGRATFIASDAASRSGGQADSKPAGGARKCSDLVKCDSKYRSVMEALLGDCVVVDTLKDAMGMSFNGSGRAVTLTGEVVLRCGAVTAGGGAGSQTGLLGREREISELEKAVTKLDRGLERQREALGRLAGEIADLEEQLVSTQAGAEKVQAELAEVRRKFYRQDEEKKRYESELEAFADDKSSLTEQLERLEREHAEASAVLAAAEKQSKDYVGRVDEHRERLGNRRAEMSSLTDKVTELKVTLSALEQLLPGLETERARVTEAHRDALKQVQECKKEAEQAEKNIAEFTRAMEEMERSAQELMEQKTAAQNAVTEVGKRKQGILEKIDLSETTLKDRRTRCQQLQERCHKLEIEISHITERVEALVARVQSGHDTDLASLTDEQVGKDELSEEERAQRVATLKRRLELMGTVNLRAVEEYDELEERHEFLLAQQKDLTKARESLMQVIRKINQTAEGMFMETFSGVRANFHDIFRHLFNGGMAKLSLEDEEDVLECGIQIEARPPGKRLQNIALLSGGESALTAIALLFAIFRAKRSPFCILDEIDAALDEANTMRFLELLEGFAEQTQFVIITHNKRTMERAGTLYGVTMAERGVSQIVSVKLREEALA
jgi:chromosome segregation protein